MNDNLNRGICEFPGCKNLKRNKGWKNRKQCFGKLCDRHHKIKRGKDINKEEYILNKKCERCGWDEGPCDRHRINNKIGYFRYNVIILCPNCHRLVTMNIIQLRIEDYKNDTNQTLPKHYPISKPPFIPP